MADYQKAFDDIAASIGGGGQTLASSLGADVRTTLKPSSGLVDKLSAFAAKSQADMNSLPWSKTITNNSPVSQEAEPLPGATVAPSAALMVGAVILAFIFLGRR